MKCLLVTIIIIAGAILVAAGCSRDQASLPTALPSSGAWPGDPLAVPETKDACGYSGKSHSVLAPELRDIGLTLCREHFAPGTEARQAIDLMISHMNSIPGTSIKVHVAGLADHTLYGDTFATDGIFKVDIVDRSDCDAADCNFQGRARMTKNDDGEIIEFDLGFADDIPWTFGPPASWEMDEAVIYFRTVFLHELNHGLGFVHVLDATPDLSIMGGKTGKWVGQKHTALKAFDYGHLRYHYPDGNDPLPDLVLSNYTSYWATETDNWKCKLTDGITRTVLRDQDQIDVSYTVMNRGSAFSGSYTTKIFLSADERLSRDDIRLATIESATTGSWPEYSTELVTRSTVIPDRTEPGLYYVIVKIDTEDDIAETKDGNNTLTIHEPLLVIFSETDERFDGKDDAGS